MGAKVEHALLFHIQHEGHIEEHAVVDVNAIGFPLPIGQRRGAILVVALELYNVALDAEAGAVPDVGVEGINLRPAPIPRVQPRPYAPDPLGFSVILQPAEDDIGIGRMDADVDKLQGGEVAVALFPGVAAVRAAEDPAIVAHPNLIGIARFEGNGVHVGV
jgi:hypothetical protein